MKYLSVFLISMTYLTALAADVSDHFDSNFTDWKTKSQNAFIAEEGRSASHCIAVKGGGEETVLWTRPMNWKAGQTYQLSYHVKTSADAKGGAIISGPQGLNRDFQAGNQWEEKSFIFTMPAGVRQRPLRLGSWKKQGHVYFDDVSIKQVQPVHTQKNHILLGSGERITDQIYYYQSNYQNAAGNSARVLKSFSAGFNSNRWIMWPGSSITYFHQIGRHQQHQGSVKVNLGYYKAGTCVVEVSTDHEIWQTIGQINALRADEFDIPESLFPTAQLYVRLKADSDTANFQIYEYACRLHIDDNVTDQKGQTHYIKTLFKTPGIDMSVKSMGGMLPGGDNQVTLHIAGLSQPEPLAVVINGQEILSMQAGNGNHTLTCDLLSSGQYKTDIFLGDCDSPLHHLTTDIDIPSLHAADYGYLIDASKGLWWSEAAHKVSRSRPLPGRSSPAVQINAARNEYEPVQLIIRPPENLKGLTIHPLPLRCGDAVIDPSHISLSYVDYVRVHVPSDKIGSADLWPDPLPPVQETINIKARQNQPFWITVYVPKNTPAGDYQGALQLKCENWQFTVPLNLHVYDFTLPDETPLQSGFGLNVTNIKSYHQTQNDTELRAVFDKYMQNFRDHRISPYNPNTLDPIQVHFDMKALKASLNFNRFDVSAARYFDNFGFNAFRLNLKGMGSGTFFSRKPGQIGKFKQGSQEYNQLFGSYLGQLTAHLKEKGWLDKAYVYWFDEPAARDYDFVNQGMMMIHRYAPELRRMLTVQPERELQGHVDIWCPVLHHFDAEKAEKRRLAGDDFWWYVCTVPKAPYCGLFIDHPAIDMRLWLWQTWKYQVSGILVWQTVHWNSVLAFPPPRRQNPYTDAMGYQHGYGKPSGFTGYWGNGDGRFLYPPKKAAYGEKSLSGPVNSIRWELMREGIEDYLYFWMLDEIVRSNADDKHPMLEKARALLQIPDTIIKSMTRYTHDPDLLYRYRMQIAEMLEQLQSDGL